MHASAAHAAHALAQVIKASGTVIQVEPGAFVDVLKKVEQPLIIVARGGIFKKHWRYLTPYRGLVFLTQSELELVLPPRAEIFGAKKIWVPE